MSNQRDAGDAPPRSVTPRAADAGVHDEPNDGPADDWLDLGWDDATGANDAPAVSAVRGREAVRTERGRPTRTVRTSRGGQRGTTSRRAKPRRSSDPIGVALAAGSRGVQLLGLSVSRSRQRLAGVPLGGGLLADRTVVVLLGGLGVNLLALWSLVGLRVGSMPAVIDLRLGVEGETELWGNSATVWRLPLLATFLAAMDVVAAAGAARLDRFAPRFVLAAGLLVQILVWIAFFGLAW